LHVSMPLYLYCDTIDIETKFVLDGPDRSAHEIGVVATPLSLYRGASRSPLEPFLRFEITSRLDSERRDILRRDFSKISDGISTENTPRTFARISI
jgi:hypothetical protein